MARVPRYIEAVTADDGIATLSVPPLSKVTVSVNPGLDFEEAEANTRYGIHHLRGLLLMNLCI